MRPLKAANGSALKQQPADDPGPNLKLTTSPPNNVRPVSKPNHLLDQNKEHLNWTSDDHSEAEIHEEQSNVGDMILDSRPINLFNETFDQTCLSMLTPELAWQNLVLPIRMHEGTLICATTKSMLDAALNMLQQHLTETPFKLTLVESHLLEMFIAERYDYEGVDEA
ncbi:hypothetical protein KS4_21620 [Poriferisphaera corsica]|uniref:Type II secretion system protein GspE N-terminal domain-containing protein n=1 Tax=Poriferisphaera corsica TaxID=2528020 RepID=A0A517YV62_9BACT|nr:hypothetical protein [Poriferisphaera corsica]QDU34100.1 hypothetical protein KS4_21620 [Poriferisphaera corsica]